MAISVGVPKRRTAPVTSRNASSIETRSTRGVKSWKTDMTSSPNCWYRSKWPPTKTRSLQSWRARHPGMPPRTPYAPGLVRRCEHDTTADRDGPAPQRRIQQLLHRGVERIEIGVQDRRRSSWRGPSCREIRRTYVRRLRVRGGLPLSSRRPTSADPSARALFTDYSESEYTDRPCPGGPAPIPSPWRSSSACTRSPCTPTRWRRPCGPGPSRRASASTTAPSMRSSSRWRRRASSRPPARSGRASGPSAPSTRSPTRARSK